MLFNRLVIWFRSILWNADWTIPSRRSSRSRQHNWERQWCFFPHHQHFDLKIIIFPSLLMYLISIWFRFCRMISKGYCKALLVYERVCQSQVEGFILVFLFSFWQGQYGRSQGIADGVSGMAGEWSLELAAWNSSQVLHKEEPVVLLLAAWMSAS